jgi:A/G-specific adenine glycosylase
MDFKRLRQKLIFWYGRNHRDLPWRRTRDPYAIWIAETMLQQTQVKTVLPYYRRFLNAFPTVQALDRASSERVLTVWAGLGYYRRAENLKSAARKIVREHHGEIPRDWNHLIALPGVGPYTAGALLSIAFDQPFPALDGNTRRLLTRVFNAKNKKKLAKIAGRLAQHPQSGHLNQALMELGATICLPRDPRCGECPVSTFCHVFKTARPLMTRSPARKRSTRKIEWPLLLIQSGGKILLRQRPPGGLLGRLWEAPGGEKRKEETVKVALMRHLNGLGRHVKSMVPVGEIRHSITDRRIRAPIFSVQLRKKTALPDSSWSWVSSSSLQRHPLSSLTRKALRLVTPS